MYNFSELKTKVGQLVQRSGDADFLTKIGIWIQFAHRTLAESYDYFVELNDIHNFSTVDGRESYMLPNRVDKPLRLYDLTNKKEVLPMTEEEYTDNNLNSVISATEGNSDTYRIFGKSGVTTAVATTGKTTQVKSSSASDTTSCVVRIEGYVDSSLLIKDYENITVSASTPTTYVAGTKTFYKITHISKSADTIGYIIIADSDGTVLEYLAPTDRVARHLVLKLGLIPDGVHSMRLLFKEKPVELVNDYDYPFTECDRFLILDAYGFALKQDNKDAQAEYIWNRAKEAMMIVINNQSGMLSPKYQHKINNVWAEAHKTL